MANVVATSPKKNASGKKKFIVILILLLLAALALGLAMWKPWIAKKEPIEQESALTVKEEADLLAERGNYAQAQEMLDEKFLKNATTDEDKSAAYLEKSRLALLSGNLDDASKFAQTAETTSSSRSALKMQASVYESRGDKAMAASYYEKVLASYSDEERSTDEGALAYYMDQEKLEELKR